MRQNWQMEAEARLKSGRHKRIWKKVVQTLACIVVFCTTYALILPAITMERQTYCGLAAHTHGESCGGESIRWSCEAQWETHHHRAVCFDEEGNLICGMAETLLHTHNAFCYGEDGCLLCSLTETEAHVHGDDCYTAVESKLLCALPESEGHVHDDGCLDEADELACGQEESEGHVHGGTCYAYETRLSCPLTEAQEHTHDESCCDESGALICGILSAARHDHDESCICTVEAEECTLPEHEHTLACYSDPEADVESAAVWADSVSAADLSGGAAERLLAVAETQLGYQESTKNYAVLADGDTTRGYTRYGAWYGDPYGDWCAMFVSFCLHYAQVEELGSDGSCGSWMTALTERGRCMAAEAYAPAPGDLVFFDTDGDRAADHMGIVTGCEEGTLHTIEGNRSDSVCRMRYGADDETILGYAVLSGENAEDAVQQVIEQIDALPTAEEATELLAALDDADESDSGDEYLTELYERVQAAQAAYDALTAEQQALVTNADKLWALAALWPESDLLAAAQKPAKNNKLDEVPGVSTRDLIEVNLYDYGDKINTRYNKDNKYPGFQQDNGQTVVYGPKSSNFGNNITSDLAAGHSKVTNNGGTINETAKTSAGKNDINRPISGAMLGTLKDGYPALADGTSLKYLFSNSPSDTVEKKNKQSIDGLFLYDDVTGAYHFNSRENHAQFNAENDTFTLYKQIISSNFMMYPFGNFLPFNDIRTQATQASQMDRAHFQTIANSALYKYNNGAGEVYKTLSEALNSFIGKMGTSWTAYDAVNTYFTAVNKQQFTATTPLLRPNEPLMQYLYTIDYDEATDFYFGMEMKMNFMQPKGGLTGKDGKQPMQFTFSGDDDVWVYIDGVLFLDLSGIHRHVGGEIDFVKGEVRYYALDTAGTGDVSEVPYKTVPFSQLVDSSLLNDAGTFKDYSQHSFNMYYMERGAGSGVCRMNFNFPVLRRNAITVGKELTTDNENIEALGDPDFRFRVMKADDSAPFIGEGTPYHLFGADGKEIGSFGEYRTGPGGVFTLKAGQQAVFPDIEEDSGSYYVEELLDPGDYGQYGKITVRGESETLTTDNVVIDSTTFTGVKSPVRDMSSGSTLFCFENQISTEKLASLSIEKKLEGYPQKARDAQVFDFAVTLDGKPLPVGTAYTVGGTIRTVEQEGIITLAPGETARISNILAGSQFTVTETAASAEGYTVTYQVNGTAVEGGAATGTVKTGTAVSVLVTNAEGGATVMIPVKKTLANPDGTERTYQFRLVQVKDNTGTTEIEDTEQLVSVTFPAGETETLRETVFTLAYPIQRYPEGTATLYYRITEVPGTKTDTFYDETVWLASVTLTRSGGTLTASPPVLWRSGDGNAGETETAVSFRNVLAVYELPQTGGPGTFLFTLCGLGLTAAAVILLRARGRKKERGTA